MIKKYKKGIKMIELKEVINTVICGESLTVLKTIPNNSVNCVITSPPYW